MREGLAFPRLWGLAALTHVISEGLGSDWLLLGASAGAIAAPSGLTLAVLASAQLRNAAVAAPFLSNHWVLASIVNVSLLAALAVTWCRRADGEWGAAAVLRAAPALRASVVAFYAVVVLHKLNWSFLDPSLSCAALFFETQGASLMPSFLPAGGLAVAGTLAAETAIPVLLWFPRTRLIGIAVALGFHGVLALNPISPFYRFSATIGALLVLFVPPLAPRTSDRRPPRVPVWSLAAPVIIILNGLSPYLGLKTESSFAMFSNLRTEGGVTNHLFIPAGFQPFAYQQDLVTITSAAGDGPLPVRVAGLEVPFLEVSRRPDAEVSYARGGTTWTSVQADPAFRPLSWLERRLLAFRAVDPGPRQWCRH